MKKINICKILKDTREWSIPCIFILLICIGIEYNIPLDKTESYSMPFLKIFSNLSYSFIAAGIFHFIVNYWPARKRVNILQSFVESQYRKIEEELRKCIQSVQPCLFSKIYSKDQFADYFEKKNLNDTTVATFGKSIVDYLNEKRLHITELLNTLLVCAEYIDQKDYEFLCKVMNSSFVKNQVVYPPNLSDEDLLLIRQIGENMYDLHADIKKYIKSLEERKEKKPQTTFCDCIKGLFCKNFIITIMAVYSTLLFIGMLCCICNNQPYLMAASLIAIGIILLIAMNIYNMISQ